MRRIKLVFDYKRGFRFHSLQVNFALLVINAVQAWFSMLTDLMSIRTFALINAGLALIAMIFRLIAQFPLPTNPPKPEEPTIPKAISEVIEKE